MNPLRQIIAFTFAASATLSALADDIVLTPPAGGGVSVTNAAGSSTWLRVAEDGSVMLPAASSATSGTIFKGANHFIHNFGSANTFIGVEAGNFTMTGDSNTASGYRALLSNTTGGYNTASGRQALYSNTTGYYNAANGASSLFSNTTGYANTASGVSALASNTTGYQNTASGASALGNNTTGIDNTANGASALVSNTTGYQNTASGSEALYGNTTGYRNTASGASALVSNTTGYQNTASGTYALSSNTTGNYNTASGFLALSNNTTGSGNTAIGYNANVASGALTNATAIGYSAVVNASNKVRLGSTSVTVIEGQVAYTFSSDRNRKENLRTVDARLVLEKLRAMNVTSWNYIGHDPAKSRHYGPMAQDFHAAFGRDEVGEFGTDTTINSGDITAVVMLGLQGLDSQVREDRRTIETLSSRIAVLEQQAAEVEQLKQVTARMAKLLGRLSQDGLITTASRAERQ